MVTRIYIILVCSVDGNTDVWKTLAWRHHFRGEVLPNKTSLIAPRFIEVSVPGKDSQRPCMCVLGVSILPLSTIVYYVLDMIPPCGIFLHNFWTVLTVWYFSTWLRNCSESVVFFDIISELFWKCGIFLHDFGTVLTVWYFPIWFLNCSDSVVFSSWFRNCSDSVVFFYLISEHFWQFGIFLHNFWTVLTVWYFST